MIVDSGGNGFVSLAGLKSSPGYGLQVQSYLKTTLIALSVGANPKRMWYLVQNSPTSTGGDVLVYLSPDNTTAPATARLSPGDSFFIGKENPWSGPVTIYSGVTGVVCFETECELQKAENSANR